MKNAKSRRSDAERAAEWYAREMLGCVRTRRAKRTQWWAVDFFGADVMGKRQDGSAVYVQVTAGQDKAVSARRKKVEQVPWHPSETVQVIQLRHTEDPANARRKLWFFRVHDLSEGQWTTLSDAVSVPTTWFRAFRGEGE